MTNVTCDMSNEKTIEESIDGFTTFGIKLWQPEVKKWYEVSVFGKTYDISYYTSTAMSSPASQPGSGSKPSVIRSSRLGNLLTDGSIIDIHGVYLLYQSPIKMARTSNSVSEHLLPLARILNIILPLRAVLCYTPSSSML